MGSDTSGSPGQTKAPRSWALGAALVLIALGLAAVLYVVSAASSKPAPGGYGAFARGEMAKLSVLESAPPQPAGVLRTGAGGETSLAAYRGKVVVLNLWATWCAPCREEMPTLAALAARYPEEVAVVPVSIDEDAKIPDAKAMLAELGSGRLGFLVDPSRNIAFEVGARGLPTTIIYDRAGGELARLSGGADWDSPDAHALIDAAIAGY